MSRAKRQPSTTSPAPIQRDLIVLTADKNASSSIKELLARPDALQIRSLTAEVIVHPQHAPGCLDQSVPLLAVYRKTHTHALVVFDREGCGQEHQTREELEALVEQ